MKGMFCEQVERGGERVCRQARWDSLLRMRWEFPAGQCGTCSLKAMDIETRSGVVGEAEATGQGE